MRCLLFFPPLFLFNLTLHILISLASFVSFLGFFVCFFLVTFGSTLPGVAEKVFWGGGAPSLLATCTCCFAPQTEATHLTVVHKKKNKDKKKEH